MKRPFAKFSPTAVVKYLMYLPLNLIPGVGTLLFIGMQGKARVCYIVDQADELG